MTVTVPDPFAGALGDSFSLQILGDCSTNNVIVSGYAAFLDGLNGVTGAGTVIHATFSTRHGLSVDVQWADLVTHAVSGDPDTIAAS